MSENKGWKITALAMGAAMMAQFATYEIKSPVFAALAALMACGALWIAVEDSVWRLAGIFRQRVFPRHVDPRWFAVTIHRADFDGNVAFALEITNKTRHPIFFDSINANWFRYSATDPVISTRFVTSVRCKGSCKALIPIDAKLLPADGWKFGWQVYGWNERAPPATGHDQIVAHGLTLSNVEETT